MNMGYLSVKDEPYHSVGNSSDQRRKNFAANPSTSGNMTGTLGNNPKQTIGFSEGQRSLIDNIIEENTKPKATWKDPVRKFMNHWAVTLTMTIVTVYALFGDDIRVAFFTKSEDTTFNIITCVALGLFTIEITLNALTQENYFNSFYFWLDVISTLSLITDISWIWNAMIGQDEDYDASNAEQAGQLARAGRGARIGTRAGRITRVIRLIRLIRIGRLWKQANNRINKAQTNADTDEFAKLLKAQKTINLMKQQKQMENSKKDIEKINRRATILKANRDSKKKNNGAIQPQVNIEPPSQSINESESALRDSQVSEELSESKLDIGEDSSKFGSPSKLGQSSMLGKSGPTESMVQEQTVDESQDANYLAAATKQAQQSESKVGKILSESTQKAVITLVLSMLLSAAVLDLELFITKPYAYPLGLQILSQTYGDPTAFDVAFEAYVDSFAGDITPLLQVIVGEFLWEQGEDLSNLRINEKQVTYYVNPITDEAAIAVHDLRKLTQTAAILGMVTTLAICVVLATGSLLLSKVT